MKIPPIFLGFTNNIDYEMILDSDTINKIIQNYQIYKKDCKKYQNVSTIKELLGYTLYCIEKNIGEEKPIDCATLLSSFVNLFPYKKTIGGTAARAAMAMAKMGYGRQIYLHRDVSNYLLDSLFPFDIKQFISSHNAKVCPHVIIQYNHTTEICSNDIKINPQYANRIIYTSDPYAKDPNIGTEFLDNLHMAKCLLVSGYNAIQEPDIFIRNMKKLRGYLARLPEKPLVYYESAKFYQKSFHDIFNQYLGEFIDIYSLNEDEFSEIIKINIDFMNPEQIYQSIINFKKEFLDVKYLLLHTRYYALIFGKDANRYYPHLCSAVDLACTRALYGERIESFQKVQKMCRYPPALDFCRKIQSFGGNIACVASADMQQNSLVTIGLGDTFVGGFLLL